MLDYGQIQMINWFKRDKPQTVNVEDVISDLIAEIPGAPGRLDIYSETWLFVQHFVANELAALRNKNDNIKLDDVATAELRGQIRFAKKLIALQAKADKVALGKPTAF